MSFLLVLDESLNLTNAHWAVKCSISAGVSLHIIVFTESRSTFSPELKKKAFFNSLFEFLEDAMPEADEKEVKKCIVWEGPLEETGQIVDYVVKHDIEKTFLPLEGDGAHFESLFRLCPSMVCAFSGSWSYEKAQPVYLHATSEKSVSAAAQFAIFLHEIEQKQGNIVLFRLKETISREKDSEEKLKSLSETLLPQKKFHDMSKEHIIVNAETIHGALGILVREGRGFTCIIPAACSDDSFENSKKIFVDLRESGSDKGLLLLVREKRPLQKAVVTRAERGLYRLVPQMDRDERVTLVESLEATSFWNTDFFILIVLSTIIASAGLLADNPAVVIGAMLVAPLMSPLLASGLSVVQGNLSLLKISTLSLTLGFTFSLISAFVFGLFFRNSALSNEILSRANPGYIDALVGLAAGMAGAYTMYRKNLSSALPGVAIAAALVPPISAAGLACGHMEFTIFYGALRLFFLNAVLIILGAQLVFYAAGIRALPYSTTPKSSLSWWQKPAVFMLFVALSILLFVPQPSAQKSIARANELSLIPKINLPQGVKVFRIYSPPAFNGKVLEVVYEAIADNSTERDQLERELEHELREEIDPHVKILFQSLR